MQIKPPFAFIPAALVLLIGCQATGVDNTVAAVNSLKEVRDALSKSEDKIDNVVSSLNALPKVEGDLQGHFKNYKTAVSAVEADSEKVQGLSDDAKVRKTELLRGWQDRMMKIQDADLRARAEERRDAATKELDELGKQVDEARDHYGNWMTAVTDIRAYLDADLSATGIESLGDKIKAVNDGADTVKKEMKDVITELDRVIERMNTTNPKDDGKGDEEKSDEEKK